MAYETRLQLRRHKRPVPRLRFALAAGLVVFVLLGASQQAAVDAMAIPDYRFGAVETYAAPAAATDLGAGWTRVTFEWARIQPNGTHEWNVVPISDNALDAEIAQGREVVGLLITTPAWATDKERGGGVPQGLYLPIDSPDNHWANFVRAIVTRYAGRIDHWTIWNEPEISPESPDATWGGSTEDFIQLLRVAYLVAKAENPNAVIHMAGMSHWHNDLWFGQFLDLLVADPEAWAHNLYFDVATLHLYHEPEKIFEIVSLYYSQMRERGISKPIWIAETNAYLSRVSEDEQAYFIFQAFALEIAAGAQRVSVYKMADAATDSAADPEQFGLVRMDGSRRPAFTAYQLAATYLAGFRGGTWSRRDTISKVVIDRGEKTTTVLWARSPAAQEVQLEARTTEALLVDVYGAARQVHPERGYYYIDLPGARCAQGTPDCAIGGAPVMLIENAPASAITAPLPASPTPSDLEDIPTPTPSPVPTFFIIPTITPTPTPTRTPAPTFTPTPTATSPPTLTPTPTLIPIPTSDIPAGRPWLLIGALALVMGGAAATAGGRKFLRR
jgi:hypothetical protein